MSDTAARLNEKQVTSQRQAESLGRGVPAWWLIFTKELSDLWIGGKALYLILAYSVFLGFQSYAQVKTSETSFVPPKEMVFAALQAVIYMAGIIGMIIGADSISGERERGTLEALLLTPASRRQIILGKFLAGLSPLELFEGVASQTLSERDVEFDERVATAVMMVSGGYPEKFEKEKSVTGLNNVFDSLVFHAGTKQDGPAILTDGGRVLCVTSLGKNQYRALEKTYDNVAKISFEKAYYRKDIGFDLDEVE